ncbi:hypothetical protein MUO79_00110, partial [Candidatus Bathyarchaeota archaeon]|nr:hypothetical protein [Candidatus Bathyarchaeota archaeon]
LYIHPTSFPVSRARNHPKHGRARSTIETETDLGTGMRANSELRCREISPFIGGFKSHLAAPEICGALTQISVS